jgi:flagellar biosynthetic protein FlhB
LFSTHTLVDAAKSCLKLALLTALTWTLLEGAALGASAGALDARGVALSMAKVCALWMLAFVGLSALFAAVDLRLVKQRFAKRMRMSRRDLRDEVRHREGEPRIKQRRRQLAREMLERARNLRSVRSADIVVTNPTHYAVALRYDPRTMVSPCVVAKGAGEFARRMRRVAFIYGVPCFEQPPLARELYRRLRVEQQVPERLYESVAALYLQLRRQQGGAAAARAGAGSL